MNRNDYARQIRRRTRPAPIRVEHRVAAFIARFFPWLVGR